MAGKRLGPVVSFGVGEWYGYLLTALTTKQRKALFARYQSKAKQRCPFKPKVEGLDQPCHKAGGVCSFRAYQRDKNGTVAPADGDLGKLRIACPSRFLGAGLEVAIAKSLIGTNIPEQIGEVGFLRSETTPQSEAIEQMDLELSEGLDEKAAQSGADVGRIDMILRNPRTGNWCAVEHQAVYFSGDEFPPDLKAIGSTKAPQIPMPGRRRPDYRSSGPKRLMPQLQIKVPSLRRWGKKMGVVVDECFFSALGKMEYIDEPSNADIAWFVVELAHDTKKVTLKLKTTHFTTLERAVEGLTAGKPVSLPEFENRIKLKIASQPVAIKKLLTKLKKENPYPGL